ncbi:MAG: carboxypeptidase-like regulatory domain-containing protein, partial [Acidobacteriota bacterium]
MKKILALFVLLGAATFLYGQAISVNGGSIQGIITDPTGAIVPNAAVTIVGTDTGLTRNLTTNDSGLYIVGPLTPGNY